VRRTLALTAAILFLGAVAVAADHQGKPKKHKDGTDAVAVTVAWGAHDVEILRQYYAPQYRSLPPGLQKKYARTGQLPPGWQKKMKPLAPSVARECAPLPTGYRRGVIDAHAVIYDSRGTIIDVAVLF
jgi:hypothetical protein